MTLHDLPFKSSKPLCVLIQIKKEDNFKCDLRVLIGSAQPKGQRFILRNAMFWNMNLKQTFVLHLSFFQSIVQWLLKGTCRVNLFSLLWKGKEKDVSSADCRLMQCRDMLNISKRFFRCGHNRLWQRFEMLTLLDSFLVLCTYEWTRIGCVGVNGLVLFLILHVQYFVSFFFFFYINMLPFPKSSSQLKDTRMYFFFLRDIPYWEII